MASTIHYIRIGLFGHVGRFQPAGTSIFPRNCRVVCRTRRGLEIGTVLSHSKSSSAAGEFDGTVLRAVTVQDDLLLARIEKNRQDALDACEQQLRKRNIRATLMDVEHLFDGQSIYFYFLGEVTPEIEAMTAELAETYEAKVQFRQFTDAVERGCGPDCGTDSAAGCGSGCSSCAIASACGTSSTVRKS